MHYTSMQKIICMCVCNINVSQSKCKSGDSKQMKKCALTKLCQCLYMGLYILYIQCGQYLPVLKHEMLLKWLLHFIISSVFQSRHVMTQQVPLGYKWCVRKNTFTDWRTDKPSYKDVSDTSKKLIWKATGRQFVAGLLTNFPKVTFFG